MNGINLNLSTRAFTQFFAAPVSRITALGAGTIANLGISLAAVFYAGYNFPM